MQYLRLYVNGLLLCSSNDTDTAIMQIRMLTLLKWYTKVVHALKWYMHHFHETFQISLIHASCIQKQSTQSTKIPYSQKHMMVCCQIAPYWDLLGLTCTQYRKFNLWNCQLSWLCYLYKSHQWKPIYGWWPITIFSISESSCWVLLFLDIKSVQPQPYDKEQ